MDNPGPACCGSHPRQVDAAPEPDWYLDNVLVHAVPGVPVASAALPAAQWRRWWDATQRTLDPRLALHLRGFVLSRDDVRRCGVGDAEVRRLVRRGAWSVPMRGALAPLTVPQAVDGEIGALLTQRRREHSLRATAALVARPGQVVSGRSSAILHGLPTLRIPDRPELNGAPEVTGGRHGRSLVRSGALAAQDVTSWFGAPVTTVARTLVDLGRHDARDAVMAADAALREGLVTRREIDQALRRARGWPGVPRSREVLRLARPEAESPLESLVRLALHDSGFPPPELQVRIGSYRVDLAWPRAKLVIEADGRGKNSEKERWREKRRDLALHRLGYRVERVTWADVVTDWPRTAAFLGAVLASRL